MKLDGIAKAIGKRIKELRELRGLTQEDFNEGIGPINDRTLRRIESGELVNMELLTLLRIAERLRVPPAEILNVEVHWKTDVLPSEKVVKKRKRRP